MVGNVEFPINEGFALSQSCSVLRIVAVSWIGSLPDLLSTSLDTVPLLST